MLEQEKERIRKERREEFWRKVKQFDFEGEILNDLVGGIYFGAWFLLIASVIGFATTMNMRYATAIIPFGAIVFFLSYIAD